MGTEFWIVRMAANGNEFAVRTEDGVIAAVVDASLGHGEPRDAETLDALISNNMDDAREDAEWLQGLIDSAGYDQPLWTPAAEAEAKRLADVADGV